MKVFKKTNPVVLAHRLPGPGIGIDAATLAFANENMLSISALPSGNYIIKRFAYTTEQRAAFPGDWVVLDDGLNVHGEDEFALYYSLPPVETAPLAIAAE